VRLSASLTPLRHQTFRLFFGARVVSLLGTAIAPIALAFAVLDLTGSTLDMGVVLAARSIPTLVFLLVGGVVADWMPRQRLLVRTSLVSGLSQAVAAGTLVSGHGAIWVLIVCEAVNGSSSAFTIPAMRSIIPTIVPRADLQLALALASVARDGAIVLGSAVAGTVVALWGSGWALAFDALTFLVVAMMFRLIKVPPAPPAPRRNVGKDLLDGWREFVSRRWVLRVVLGFTMINAAIAGAWNTLGPVVLDRTIGRGWWGILTAAVFCGLITGSTVMGRVKPRHPLRAGILAISAYAVHFTVLGLAPNAALLVASAVLAGLGTGVFGVVWDMALQTNVPPDRLSRVMSCDMFFSMLALPVGQFAAGFLAAWTGTRAVVVAGGALVAVAVLVMLSSAQVRALTSARPEESVNQGKGGDVDVHVS
jgi:MFS family permease